MTKITVRAYGHNHNIDNAIVPYTIEFDMVGNNKPSVKQTVRMPEYLWAGKLTAREPKFNTLPTE